MLQMSSQCRLLSFFRGSFSRRAPSSFKLHRLCSTSDSSILTVEKLQYSEKLNLKKDATSDSIQSVDQRIKAGVPGGSLALHQIRINGPSVIVPQDAYNPLTHRLYPEEFKTFFAKLFGTCDEPVEDWQYLDIQKYVAQKIDERCLILLRMHPFLLLGAAARRFVPTALNILRNLNDTPFLYPLESEEMGQSDTWEAIYKAIVCEREADIQASINRLDGVYKDLIATMYSDYQRTRQKSGDPVRNNNAIDELVFFTNVCTHIWKNMKAYKIPTGEDFYPVVCKSFREVPTEMYLFFWLYRIPPSKDFPSHLITLQFVEALRT